MNVTFVGTISFLTAGEDYVKHYVVKFDIYGTGSMLSAKSRAELGERAARFLKAELKRADVTYDELAKRLKEYGLDETRDSIASKLKRGSFPATFFLACCGALNLASVQLKDI